MNMHVSGIKVKQTRPQSVLQRDAFRRFHPRAVALNAAPRSRFTRAGLLLILAAVTLVLMAAFFIRLPVVEQATGMIIPAGSTIEVRPTMAGQVASLGVTEGGTVRKGMPLLALDSSVLDAQVASIDSQLSHLQREQEMLDALIANLQSGERNPTVLTAPQVLADPYRREFEAQVSAIFSTLETLEERGRQLDASVLALEAERQTLQSLRPIYAERMDGFQQLEQSGSGTRASMLEAQEALIEVDGQIEAATRRIEEASHEQAQTRLQAGGLLAERVAEYSARSRQVLSEISRLETERSEKIAQRDQQVLIAPVDAVVNQLRVSGPGVNVMAEEHLMTLVPIAEHVVIEALVANSAIAFVEVGQTALLKLDALPFQRYGTVAGEVISVGATSVETEAGDWRYPVRISVSGVDAQTSSGHAVSMRPGMTLRADILTEERSLASYFLDVITSATSEGMGER